MKRCIFFIIVIIFSLNFISAHQPRLVFDTNLPQENPFLIQNPEVSQAFYGQLKGSSEYFVINSNEDFNLYVQILSPYLNDARKDFSIEITGKETFAFNGTNYRWRSFYEEFGGDYYWQGPAIEENAESGTYLIKVYNPNNLGKYVLVVGRKESFPMNEAINAIVSLPKLKTYFNKSPLTAFFNVIGLSFAVIIVAFMTIILLIILIIKKTLKTEKHKLRKNIKKNKRRLK